MAGMVVEQRPFPSLSTRATGTSARGSKRELICVRACGWQVRFLEDLGASEQMLTSLIQATPSPTTFHSNPSPPVI
jgi:hypothetical protein